MNGNTFEAVGARVRASLIGLRVGAAEMIKARNIVVKNCMNMSFFKKRDQIKQLLLDF